jgi:hypothetical protein
MGKNIIVSEETLRDLLEAHASLSAWYYELWSGLRAANATARTPDDAARAAFVERLATDFPEIAAVARSIRVPRMYVPAPPTVSRPAAPSADLPAPPADEPATLIEPAPARLREKPISDIAPPPLVDRSTLEPES